MTRVSRFFTGLLLALLKRISPDEKPDVYEEAYRNGWSNALEAVRTGKEVVVISIDTRYASLEQERHTDPVHVAAGQEIMKR